LKQANINPQRKVDYVPLHKILYEMKQNNDEFQEKVQTLENSWEGLAAGSRLWTFKGERMMNTLIEKNSIFGTQKSQQSITQISLTSESLSSNVKIQPKRRISVPIRSSRKSSGSKEKLLVLSGKSCASFFREDPLEDFLRKSLREDEEVGPTEAVATAVKDNPLRYNSFLQAYSGPTAASLNEQPLNSSSRHAGRLSKYEESSIVNVTESIEEKLNRIESGVSLIKEEEGRRIDMNIGNNRHNVSVQELKSRESVIETEGIEENAEWNYKSNNQSELDIYPKMPAKVVKVKSRPFSSSGSLRNAPIHARPASAMGEIKKVSLSKVLFGLHKEAEAIEKAPLHVKKMVIEAPMDSQRYLKSAQLNRHGRNKSSAKSLISKSEAFLVVHGQNYPKNSKMDEKSMNSPGLRSWTHELSRQKGSAEEIQIINMHRTNQEVNKRPASSGNANILNVNLEEKSQQEKSKNVLDSWVSRDKNYLNFQAFQKPNSAIKNKLAF